MREDDIRQVHARGVQGMQAAIEAENAAFRQAELSGDLDSMAASAQRIAGMRATVREMGIMAQEEFNRRAAPPQVAGAEDMPRRDVDLCRKFGISPNELGVAKNWTSAPNLSDDDKVQTYLQNKQRYQYAKATGQYRDDQGTQRNKF
jgi:hypothetical protein